MKTISLIPINIKPVTPVSNTPGTPSCLFDFDNYLIYIIYTLIPSTNHDGDILNTKHSLTFTLLFTISDLFLKRIVSAFRHFSLPVETNPREKLGSMIIAALCACMSEIALV